MRLRAWRRRGVRRRLSIPNQHKVHESRHSRRRAGHPHLRRDPSQAEADGRDRRPPILWHIMKIYSAHGVNDFVICCGYKGYVIKEYFANYFLHMSDVTFDMATNSDGGASAEGRAVARDAGRHRRGHDDRRPPQARRGLRQGRDVLLHLRRRRLPTSTSARLIEFHRSARQARDGHGGPAAGPLRRARVQTARRVDGFVEKPRGDGGLDQRRLLRAVAAGARPASTATTRSWEARAARAARRRWAADGVSSIDGFWQPMDTLRDKTHARGALGSRARRPGRSGVTAAPQARFLARQARPGHRPHRLQGRVARRSGCAARRRGAPAIALPPPTTPDLFADARRRATCAEPSSPTSATPRRRRR